MDEIDDVIERYDERYRIVEHPALRRAEMQVIGGDYGASSYTTKTQAEVMGRMLGLRPGRLFLDVGSGAGWPGIFLAASTGAGVVLTDIPLEGLLVASRRVRDERVDGHIVASSGNALPFSDCTFDAVTGSDVLC